MDLMSGGREFQRRGAERLKALAPMVDRRAGGDDEVGGGGRSETPGGDIGLDKVR